MPTLGTMHSITASPRTACGQNNSAKPHSAVMCELSHRLKANRIRPTVIMIRRSTVCETRAATMVLKIWAMPTTKTVSPICRQS